MIIGGALQGGALNCKRPMVFGMGVLFILRF